MRIQLLIKKNSVSKVDTILQRKINISTQIALLIFYKKLRYDLATSTQYYKFKQYHLDY